ncbi:DUF2922 domain-containing protein [Clostridium sp. BSD9I1]|uniref:DUF2922 domain-containing protein n=1 Tax=Clostridium sp. BSD9I1 TaxID=2003589 RepID=UPI001647E994|nr:DUF2922 domain-containing protein [Clostridium sp. BSD9I1]
MNSEGSRASITLPGLRDNITESEVSAAMDVVIACGGDLKSKHAAQITERNVTDLKVTIFGGKTLMCRRS